MAFLCVAIWTLVVVTHGTFTSLLLFILGADRMTAGIVGIADFLLIESLLIWTNFGADPVSLKLRRLQDPANTTNPLQIPLQPNRSFEV